MIAFLARSRRAGMRAIRRNPLLEVFATTSCMVKRNSDHATVGFIATTTDNLRGKHLTGIVLATDVPTELLTFASNRLVRGGLDLEAGA